MALPSLWQSSLNYKISTDVFEGPLDLLLQLIENAELDITKLSLAKVTDQFLKYLQNLTDRDPIEVSAFLVIGAKLVFIKSSILLPSQLEIDEDTQEDIGYQLARQLIEYKKYKRAALWLNERQENGLRSYYRVSPPPVTHEKIDLSGMDVFDLIEILMDAYFTHDHETPMSDVVTITPLTIRKRIQEIKNLMQVHNEMNFSKFIEENNSRLNIVVTFLALLELIKNYALTAAQDYPFREIRFNRTPGLNKEFETEL
jgi:segregation and condensation protein A